MSRRGHLYKRGTSWTYVLDISLPGQRRRQKTKAGYRTKRDALAALNEAQAALQRGIYVEPSKLSVKTFLLDHWLPAIESGLRKSTLQGYRSAITNYVLPRLGETRLQALTPDQLNAFYRAHRAAQNQLKLNWARRTRTSTWSSVATTGHRFIQIASRRCSTSTSRTADSPASGCTTSATHMRRWLSLPVSIRRS